MTARIGKALVDLDVRREFGAAILGRTLCLSGSVPASDEVFASVQAALAAESE